MYEALDMISPVGPERMDYGFAMLLQWLYALSGKGAPDLEALLPGRHVLGSRASTKGRSPAARESESGEAGQAMRQLRGSGVSFRVVTREPEADGNSDDRDPGAGHQGAG